MEHRARTFSLLLGGLLPSLVCGCADDDEDKEQALGGATAQDGGGAGDGALPAPGRPLDASLDATFGGATGDAGAAEQAQIARGEYLALHVSDCNLCHTPGAAAGMPDRTRLMSGVDCFVDADPSNPTFGCVSAPNLTNHETGLKNRSDEEVKDMFLRGVRPNGEALHPFMPYWSFANMTNEDADAIVAYLRSLPPVDRQIPPKQPPFFTPAEPTRALDLALVPAVPADDPRRESAQRGRYLATQASLCLQCHTPEVRSANPPLDTSRIFHGGSEFAAAGLGLPVPPFPMVIYASNLTSHPTDGIGGWTVEQIATALKTGVRPDGSRVCPPMPAGPNHAFGGMTDEDARDIAAYLLSLPPAAGKRDQCSLPGAF